MSFLSVYGYSPSFLKFSRVVTLASTATSDNLVGENCRGRRKNISIFRDFKFVEDKSSNIFFFPPSFQRFDRSIFENRSSSNEFSRQWEIFPPLEALERKHIRRGGGVSIELRHIDSEFISRRRGWRAIPNFSREIESLAFIRSPVC